MPGLTGILCWWDQAGVQLGHLEGADENLDLDMSDYTYLSVIFGIVTNPKFSIDTYFWF